MIYKKHAQESAKKVLCPCRDLNSGLCLEKAAYLARLYYRGLTNNLN